MRKLVTVRVISEVRPIPGADAIECIQVDGWQLVSKKGEFKQGDSCVYFEIDSFLPANDERFAFLKKTGTKTDETGAERIRLRTVKLRGQISQGLALPLDLFSEIASPEFDVDYSDVLNVTKYERPEPKCGDAAGDFPSWINRTDEERVQNIYGRYSQMYKDLPFEPTLKLDGSSITMAYIPPNLVEKYSNIDKPDNYLTTLDGGHFIVCSRTLQRKFDPDTHFWKGALAHDWLGFLQMLCREYLDEQYPAVIQGELLGPGIQGNREKLPSYQVFAFNAWDVETQSYFDFGELRTMIKDFDERLPVVPVLGEPECVFKRSLEEILEFSEGPSINHPVREGIVWKSTDPTRPSVSFKSISNQFLLKGGD